MDPLQALGNLLNSILFSFDSLLRSVPYEYLLLFVGIFPLFMLALALYFFERKKALEKDVSVLRKKFETYASTFFNKCDEVLTEKKSEIEGLIEEKVIPESIKIFTKTEFFKSIAPNFDGSQLDKEKIKAEVEKTTEYLELKKELSELLDKIKNEAVENIKKF
ncbi:MAG: HTTM domain-containing protein [Candidatus Aenigmarchaeota archaeon]|nr:HTTM domain-containing protein [Candidatus Aenigmarchaeota archaeon]